MSDHETTLRKLADWFSFADEREDRAACLAGADALRRGPCGTCGTCKHDGCCGIQAACVSSQFTDKRATGCTGAYEPKAPTEPTR